MPDTDKPKLIDELLELLCEEQRLSNGPLTAKDTERDRHVGNRIRALMRRLRVADGVKS